MNRRRPISLRSRRRHGSVFFVTVLICFGLAGLVLALSRNVRVELLASNNEAAMAQASMIEQGAEQYVQAILTEQKDALSDITYDYYDTVRVGDGYFWVIRPDYGDPDMDPFGLTDEAGKLNINTATYEQLMMLPNMTDDVAASIVNWRTASGSLNPSGAGDDYYSNLKPEGYSLKSGPFETVEELRMVRGVTWELLYGTGQAPPLGQQSQIRQNAGFMTDLQTARGLYDYLTIYSAETVAAANGGTSGGASGGAGSAGGRININNRNQRTQLRDLLRNQLGNSRGDQVANTIGQNDTYRDIFDFYFQMKLKYDEFTKIVDRLTSSTSTQPTISGRININSAPREVLLCLGLDTADVDKIVSMRQSSQAGSTSVAWIVEAIDKKAIGLENKITGKSTRYSADILAVSGNGRAFKRVRIVVNASSTTPQIVYRRDVTERGWPLDQAILKSLRDGQGPGALAGGRAVGMGGLRQ